MWSNAGEGAEVFVWLMQTTDPEGGKVQDEFKREYAKITLASSDGMAQVIKQLNLKWFIYSSLRINDTTIESVAREGIREMLLMLIAGPKSVASEALLMLSAVESMTLATNDPGGTWVAQRITLYERYGDQMALVNGDGGSLMPIVPNEADVKKRAEQKAAEQRRQDAINAMRKLQLHGLLPTMIHLLGNT